MPKQNKIKEKKTKLKLFYFKLFHSKFRYLTNIIYFFSNLLYLERLSPFKSLHLDIKN